MQESRNSNPFLEVVRGNIATIFVIAVGYIVSFTSAVINNSFYSPLEITLSVLAGVVYTFLCLQADWLMDKLPDRWKTAVYFTIQLSLCAIIVTIIAPGAIWLIFMPLIGISVETLSPVWRWVLYALVVAGLALPVGIRYDQWDDALFSALTFSPAIVFVVIFTQLRLNEENARQKAEQLTAELAAANHQLAAYAAQATELATTHERNRLAREIHDNLGHYLTVVNVQIEAARLLMDSQPDRAKDALDKAQRLTQEGLTAVRQSVSTLRDSPVENRPLGDALATLVEESQSAGILTHLNIQGEPRSLDTKTKLTLYRVVQEGLTNVRKHARASRVDLWLDYRQPQTVQLTIQDNGVGTAVSQHGGFGLLGVRERVHQLGGEVQLETSPGHGFKLAVAVPG